MDIQAEFEAAVNRQQITENKLDLTKDNYDPRVYQSALTNLAFRYFMVGMNVAMGKN